MKSNLSHSTTQNNLISIVAFTVLFLIYVAFPTKNYYYDGIFFALTIEEASTLKGSLIHPNHLIYSPFGYLAYHLSQTIGLMFRSVQILQVLNSLASVLSAYILFRIVKEVFQSTYLAWCMTFLFAFSATWWKFSIDADAYVVSVLFLLISFYLVLPKRSPRPWLLILTFALAVFFHQLAVLFYPIIILGLHWQASVTELTNRRRLFIVLQFALGSFVLIFTVYCLAFYFAAGTFSASRFARWITSYSPDVSFSFNLWSNLLYTLRGHGRLFFGGRFSLMNDLPGWLRFVLLMMWLVLIGLLIIKLRLTLRSVRFRRPVFAQEKFHLDHFAKLCGLWILIYVVFLFFWLPHNTFYRLFYLPAIILLISWFISKGLQPSHKYRLALFVAIMALANFLFSILPYAYVDKNPPLAFALDLNRQWPAGTVVYYASENSDNNLVRYFSPDTVWKPLADVRQLQTEIGAGVDQSKPTWLETTAIDLILTQPDGTNWLDHHVKPESRRELNNRAYRIKFYQVVP